MACGLWHRDQPDTADALVSSMRVNTLKIRQQEDALAHERRINEEYKTRLARYESRSREQFKRLCPAQSVNMQIGGEGLEAMSFDQVVALTESAVLADSQKKNMEIADLKRRLETTLALASKMELDMLTMKNRRLGSVTTTVEEPAGGTSTPPFTEEKPVVMTEGGITVDTQTGEILTSGDDGGQEDAALGVSDKAKVFLRVMGAKGYSRLVDIRGASELANESGKGIQDLQNELSAAGLVRTFNLSNGAPGRPYTIVTLTEAGEEWYRNTCKKDPVDSQHARIVAQHASPEHGWAIFDAGMAMEKNGYEVIYERAKLRFKTGPGKEVNADLVSKRDGEVRLIEVETGTSSQEDIDYKLTKLYDIQQTFWIVCPNKPALDTIEDKVFKWIASRGGRPAFDKLALSFATISMLAEDQWKTTIIAPAPQGQGGKRAAGKR